MNNRVVLNKALLVMGLIFLMTFSFFQLQAQNYQTPYQVKGNAIVGENTGRYNNRPLYINNTNGFILTGDKPLIRLAKDDQLFGNLIISCKRGRSIKKIIDFDQVTSMYVPGQMKWKLSDSQLKGLELELNTLPVAKGIGMVICIKANKCLSDDKLLWSFGGGKQYKGKQLSWIFDVMGHPDLLSWSDLDGADISPKFNSNFILQSKKAYYLSFIINQDGSVSSKSGRESENDYQTAQKKLERLLQLVKINTPDSSLNVIAQASVVAINGTWYPPVFVHGCMQWNRPLPGWRTIFGGTMYGWHDRVLEEAKYYTDAQIKISDKKEAKADTSLLLTGQHAESRFYGVGRIYKDQSFYDMQTQFFDQIVEEYRWTANPELVNFFREALELHLNWMRDCFDPDGDGVYESYLNAWPTDSQWYNGGGTAEETSYAYRGHLAARDMAHNAGDTHSENYHNKMLDKIKKGFFEKLWIQSKGYSGAYREQGGHERLHQDPWLYSIFLPVDAGLTSQLQSVESVYYSEWALQNDQLNSGGRQVWTSNWVPAIWSIRELWPGDNYHLALSYFQAGLPDDGYDIFRGTFKRTAFNHISPGNFGGIQGGIDFGDCVHPFARTLVEGLFGYNPDYPNGKVRIAPQFPSDWTNASIELPDVKIAFERKKNTNNYFVQLARKGNLELLFPVQCAEIKNVMLNGEKVKWELLPTVGRSLVKIELPQSDKAEVTIETGITLPYYAPVTLEGNVGDVVDISAKDARIISVEDPQGVVEKVKSEKGELTAKLTNNKGYHTIVAQTISGNAPQMRVFRIKINDLEGDAKEKARYVDEIPKNANWKLIGISSLYNADVTTIYQQKYLTPRFNTVSARLGTDGYSPWTFPYWRSLPPIIKMDNLKSLLDVQNRLLTPQGVPFNWNMDNKNIAFTSMWDNYPKKIDFPVNKTGKAIYFLISGSTNIMQCQIANAVIRLNYSDGKTDSLELIPPVNYWNLSTIDSHATAPGQLSRIDYTSEVDRFCMPAKFPETVRLGENCRAMLLNLKLRKDVELKSVTLETLSQEVVVGLIGMTILN